MNFQLRHNLVWQIIGPIPLMVIAAIVAVWFIVPRMIANNATDRGDHHERNRPDDLPHKVMAQLEIHDRLTRWCLSPTIPRTRSREEVASEVISGVLATQKRSARRPRRKPYVLKVVDDANVRTQVFTNRIAADAVCPLLALSGHDVLHCKMSAYDPRRTSAE